MAASQPIMDECEKTTEQGLRQVTAGIVLSMIDAGHEAAAIRRSVMHVATKVIHSLAANEYQIETHTAIVQRTIESLLRGRQAIECPDPLNPAGM